MFPWPLMTAELHGVSSQTGNIKTIINGVSVHSDEASACRKASSMSFGSYSCLVMQELVQRKIKAFMTTPKISSSEKVGQYGIPPSIEQSKEMSKSSVVIRKISFFAYRSGG